MMLKNKKNAGILILITLILTLAIILTTKIIKNKDYQENNNQISINSNERDNKVSSILSSEEKQEAIDEIKNEVGNKTNKEVLVVNGERISEKEIAWTDFQRNNPYADKYFNKNGKKVNAVDEVIKQYIILQDAREKEIILTDKEIKNIEEKVKESFKENDEEMQNVLKAVNMNYDEFLEFYTDSTKKSELKLKWTSYITDAINSGKINIDSEKFNEKYKEYQSTSKLSLLYELIDIYIEYLKEKATIEYIN